MVTVTGNTRRQADAGPGDRPSGSPARNRDDRPDPATGNHPDRNRGARRHPRTIRFSHSEWALIEQAAGRQGLGTAELVRSGALALAEERLSGHPPASLSTGHLALVETTWRAVHLLATLATRHLPCRDIDDLVGAAHHAMLDTMHDGPDRTVPGQAPSDHGRQRHDKAGRARSAAPRYRIFQAFKRKRPQAAPPSGG
ncbi:MAG: hypothetical protein OXC11_15700 [Rhodospirillales bacterium]|nr:hypothetical protein [Rhodospirillales bacterium]